jgi:hypothetical protein
MLCIKQVFAIILSLMLILLSVFIWRSIIDSWKENCGLQKIRRFRIPLYLSGRNSTLSYQDDQDWRVAVNLDVVHRYSTIMVDEPVDVFGTTIIKPGFMPKVSNILLSFQSAQAYPSAFDKNGVIKGGAFYLSRSQDNKITGNTKISWPLEGQFGLDTKVEYEPTRVENDPNEYRHNTSKHHEENLITVYPKSLKTEIATNKALIALAIGAYIVGAVGAIGIITDLWSTP